MRPWRLVLAGALALGLARLAPESWTTGSAARAATGKRVALVIGNQSYQQVRPLYAPVDDAKAWRAALLEAGFQVEHCFDCTKEQMGAKIKAFSQRIAEGDEAFFFYAGHGAEQDHINYLFPVDAEVEDCPDLYKWGIGLNSVLGAMEKATVSIAVLDACRDAPFPSCQYAAVGGDLFVDQPVPNGTLVAYATRSGYRAEDAVGRLSPYTRYLLPLVRTPGLPLVEALSLAKPKVLADTDKRQQPFESNSLGGAPWVLHPGPHPQVVQARQQEAEARRKAADAAWGAIAASPDGPEKYSVVVDFLAEHGGSGASSALVARDWLKGHIGLARSAVGAGKPEATPALVAVAAPPARSHVALKGTAGEMPFVALSGGEFRMGSRRGSGSSDERPRRRIRVSAFAIGQSEVTQAQWAAVVKAAQEAGDADAAKLKPDPSHFKGADRPVEQVSWCEAARFANALSRLEGRTPAYTVGADCETGGEVGWDRRADGYRLPTEAEWEYAARAGTSTAYATGSQEADLARAGWYSGNSDRQTHEVCTAAEKPWGLCDLHGNVWEWVWDWYAPYDPAELGNPVGPSRGDNRVLRGGSCFLTAVHARSANRYWFQPSNSIFNVGFRLVLPVAAPER